LIASGTLTISVARANARGRSISLPTNFNHCTGRESKIKTGFNDTTWGDSTRQYTESASNLADKKFNAIIKEAEQYASIKQNRNRKRTEAADVIEINDKPERACLVSEDEDE
jgi:hypothetical protein